MARRVRSCLLALIGVGASTLLAAGCGAGGGEASGPSPAGEQVPAVTKDAALAALVPADIAASGTILVGTDASYAPNEFTDTDGQTVIGMDVDLGTAIARKLGLTARFQNAAFSGLLAGIAAGKYGWGMSSFTINAEREKSVDLVSYFNVGTKAAVLSGNPDRVDLDQLCGRQVAVQSGSVQFDDLTARSRKCQVAGKPAIAVTSLQAQTDVTLALTSRRVVAMLADAPVVNYAVTQTHGQLQGLGDQYLAAPYGIALRKGHGRFAEAVRGAVQALMDDGTYSTIISKWHGTEGAITKSEINPNTGQ